MPSQKYVLEKDGAKRLEIGWGIGWKNVSIRLDGQEIGSVATQKELKQGRVIAMPDGSTLSVQLSRTLLSAGLRVLRNGELLPGSAADPAGQLGLVLGTVLLIGSLNLVLGAAAGLGKVAFLEDLGIGWLSALFGVVFLLLGYFINRRSRLALAIVLVLFVMDTFLSVNTAIQLTNRAPTGVFVARLLLLLTMWQGFSAIRTLKKPAA